MKKFELISFPTADALADAVAKAWLAEIGAANLAGKSHCVALSGGQIARKFFLSAVEQAQELTMSFDRVHFFWGDERCVPPTDAESNYRIAHELLLAPLRIPESQIHRVRGEERPEAAAAEAEAEIRRFASVNENGQPVLDLIFLGLGEDGHVASLFPGEPGETASGKAVYRAVTNSPKPPPRRVTLGYPAIAAARQVWMLASGHGKEASLRQSLAPDGRTPFARLLGLRSHTRVFTDAAVEQAR